MTRAAQITQTVVVHRGASRAALENHTGDDSAPVELRARRSAIAARDRLDAERWLDEGGSFRREAVTPMTAGTLIAPPSRPLPPSNPQSRPLYACPECGHRLRVSGLGRHRVYFELDDERSDHPVLNRVCPQCGRGLPGKNPL